LSSLTAEDVVKLFEADVRSRKRMAELLVSEPDMRLAIINAVLRDVATKSDIEALRREFKSDIEALRVATKSDIEALRVATKSDIEGLRRDVSELRERVSKLEGAFTQLVDRIGDLDKRIDSLDRRIDALDKRIDSLDKRIDYTTKVSWALTISVLATLVVQFILMFLRIH
jgi:predicted nuclease with TOPRIM domain